MALFAYEAMNSSGQEVKDEIEAADSSEAIAKIRGKGFFPTKVKEKAARKTVKKKKQETESLTPKRKMPISIGGVPRKQLVSFTRQLSTLQDAGLPILRSLQILEQQQKPGLLKAVIGGVCDEVEGGGTLSEAMTKYPKAFDKLYTNMINAGEAGGVLDLILARLADFMEKGTVPENVSFLQSLVNMIQSERITEATGLQAASNPRELSRRLRGIDSSSFQA